MCCKTLKTILSKQCLPENNFTRNISVTNETWVFLNESLYIPLVFATDAFFKFEFIRIFIYKTKPDILLKTRALNLTVRHFIKNWKFQKIVDHGQF